MASSRDDKKSKERRNLAKKWAEEQDKSGSASCVQPPEGVDILKLKVTGKDPLKLDFLPFRAGKNNFHADEGEEAIEKTYEMHWIPTLSNKNKPVACRAFCFNERCAVCNWLRKNGGKADEDFVRKIRAKRRHLWLVTDKPGSKNPPLKLLDSSDKNQGKGFAELMSDAVNSLGDDKDAFSLDEGCTASIIVKEQTGGSFTFDAATRIDFRERDYSYPDSMLESNPCLDDCIIDPGYDEVMELLEPSGGGGKESENKGSKPSRSSVSKEPPSRNGDEDDTSAPKGKPQKLDEAFEAGDRVEYDGEELIVRKVRPDGRLNLVDDDNIATNDVDPALCIKLEVKTSGKDDDDD